MGDYILAHDLGTSGNKAALFSVEGSLKGSCIYTYKTHQENILWAEQDAQDWWEAVRNSTRQLLDECRVKAGEVRAVSFSGQMMGVLPVDEKGTPLRRAIIWADQRAQKERHLLAEKITDDRFYQINGHRNTASYGIQKAMWIKENQQEIYENTYKFLNAKDYIVFCLTGKFYTDCSDANSMTCFDLKKRQWSEEVVNAADISMDKLPDIVESTYFAGYVTREAAKETGLSEKTMVIMGAGDGVAANIGAGCIAPGKAYCCIGTSAWVAATSEEPVLDPSGRIVCWAHAVPGMYSPNGTMQYAGGAYKWLKETVCHEEMLFAEQRRISPYEIMNDRIASCKPGADGVLFLPYLMGERAPRWNPDAMGVFFGLTALTRREHILRSVMEGVILNLGICFDILKEKMPIHQLLLIGGVAESSQWRKCAADIFGAQILIPEYLEEANSMGAAVIAGVGSGLYNDFTAINRFIEIKETIGPCQENQKIYEEQKKRFEKLYEAVKSLYGKI